MVNQKEIDVRMLLWFKLVGADITTCALRTDYTALVGRRAHVSVGRIDSRATRQQRMRQRWAAVVRQRFQQRIRERLIPGCGEVTAPVVVDIVTAGRDSAGAALVLDGAVQATYRVGQDRVGQRQVRRAAPKRRHHDSRRSATGRGVACERRVGHRELAVGVEHRSAVPRRRHVPAERAVDDGGVTQRPHAARHIGDRCVAADRAADDVERAPEEAVDSTPRLVEGGVVSHHAVGEVQRGSGAIVDPATAKLEVRRPSAGLGVVPHHDPVEVERAEVEDATTLWGTGAIGNDEVVHGDSDSRTDLEHP